MLISPSLVTMTVSVGSLYSKYLLKYWKGAAGKKGYSVTNLVSAVTLRYLRIDRRLLIIY